MVKCIKIEFGSMSILYMYRYFNLINLKVKCIKVEFSVSNGNFWFNLMKIIIMYLIYSVKCLLFGIIKKKRFIVNIKL